MQNTRANNQQLWITAIWIGLVAFCLYTCLFSFRKAFNVGEFAGPTLLGLHYKVVLVVTQVMGYMASKFYGVRFIAEMQKVGRGKLILFFTAISWLAWLVFALVPPPFNFWCLFLNGFPLGLLWGIVFSYVEGRRMTDLISAALAVSFIFGAGIAKSVGAYLMATWAVPENWMPFATSAVFAPPLLVFVYLMEKIPPPTAADIKDRSLRLPMNKQARRALLRNYGTGISLLVLVYTLVTILREIRDSFMADMWRESGEKVNNLVFAQTESIIAFIILIVIAAMVFLKDNRRAFMLTHMIMMAGFLLSLSATLAIKQGMISSWWWMILVGLGLYLVYIPFNSILFERFIAAFRITGNVGFLIYLADSTGYLGSVAVMLGKNLFHVKISWLGFYSELVLIAGILGLVATLFSLLYFSKKN